MMEMMMMKTMTMMIMMMCVCVYVYNSRHLQWKNLYATKAYSKIQIITIFGFVIYKIVTREEREKKREHSIFQVNFENVCFLYSFFSSSSNGKYYFAGLVIIIVVFSFCLLLLLAFVLELCGRTLCVMLIPWCLEI